MPVLIGIIGLLWTCLACGADPPKAEQARLLDQANSSYAARLPLEAIHLYREYLANYPDRADVRVFLGAALFNLGKPVDALEETRRALLLDKTYGRAHTLAGRIHAARHEWDRAQREFSAAIKLDRSDREAQYFSGRAYYDEGRFEQSIEAFQRALALGPGQSRIFENLGLASEALGGFAKAEQAYKRGIELSTGEYRPYLAYGVFLQKQGRTAESIQLLERALSLDPENVDARFELGKALLQSGQLEGASRVLEPASSSSNQCRIHYLLVGVYSQQARNEDANRQEKALENCRNEP